MIRVNVSLANASVTETETLTAGRVGLECGFTFSSEWDDLLKVAVFEGEQTIEVALGTASVAVVPPECMATAGYNLRIGVYGLSPSNSIVIPTVWAKAGKIKDSAGPDEDSFAPATPELVAQIMSASETALSIAQGVAAAAEAGELDGVSPTVAVTETTGGHTVTITDRDGDHSFDVMDGASAYDQAVEGGYTESEQQFNTDLARFKTYAEEAEASANAASQSATNAGDSASAAASSATAALNAKTAAEQARTAAAQSATNAATAANNASTKASEAAQSATSAASYAATATQKASEASASATAAAGSATNARSAASAAAASATAAGNAQTAAETAQGKAEDAQEAAETAQDAAEAAAASVSASAAQIAQNTADIAQNTADIAQNTADIAQNTADIAQNTADIAELQADQYKAFATDTASGAVASFPDGADDIPVKSLVVDIEPVQDLHGYDAPWPAGGGVNLLPPYSLPSVTNRGVTLTNNNGEYTLDGTADSGAALFDININLPAAQYTVAFNNPTANPDMQIYGIDENNAVPMQVLCSTANTTATVTFESTVKIFRIRVLRDGTVDNFKLSPVFSAGATAATKFYPYSNICPISGRTGAVISHSGTDMSNPETLSITFPTEAGTVYGGTLDVTTGVLTVDMAMVDMGTLGWVYYSAQQRFVAQVNSAKPAGANVGLDGACSVYKVVNTGYRLAPDKSVVIGNNFISNQYSAMVVHDEDYTDAATFKTAVSGQTLVFPIETPVTYQLTPTEVTTLLAQNNIWADCGDSTVEYRADTALYVDKKIAALAAALS